MTNLTPKDDPEELMPTPDPGEEIRSGGVLGFLIGAVRPGFQVLLNKVYSVFVGRVWLRSVSVGRSPGSRVADVDLPDLGSVYAVKGIAEDKWEVANDGGTVRITQAMLEFPRSTILTNPPKTEPLKNQVRALNIPKAWGVFRTTDVPSYKEGASFDGAGVQAGDHQKMDFTLAVPMADTNYSVVATVVHPNGHVAALTFYEKTSNRAFTLGCGVDLTAANYEFNVLVFGRQT